MRGPDAMQRPVLMFAALAALAVVATLLLRPDAAVQFEAELAAMEPEAALARMAEADPALAGSENLALLHGALALDAADTMAVRRALGSMTGTPEVTALVQEQLSEAARLDGNLTLAIRHLRAANDAEPSVARRLRLGVLLRLARDTEAEMALLSGIPPSGLTTGEAERLAQLLLQARRFDDLETTYRRLSEKPEGDTAIFRQRLIDLQVESGRAPEAVTTALRWFAEGGNKPGPMELAVPVMITRGAIDEAFYLATRYMRANPDDSFAMIRFFARSGHRAIAMRLQDLWFASARSFSPEAWLTLIDFANTTGDPRGLRRALSMTDPAAMDPALLRDVLLQLVRYQGVTALTPYRRYLTPDFLADAPLPGAAWAFSQGRQEEAAAYLLMAARGTLADWEVQIWLMIARGMAGGPAYAALLANGTGDARIDGALDATLISAGQTVPNP